MLRVGGSQSQGKDILLTALLEKDQEPGSEKQLCPPDKPGHPPTAPPSVRSDVRWGVGAGPVSCHSRPQSLHHRQRSSSPQAGKITATPSTCAAVGFSSSQEGQVPLRMLPGIFLKWPTFT